MALYTLAILYRSRSQHGTLPTFVHLLGQQLVILLLFEFYHLRGTVHLGYTVQVKVTAWYPAYLCPSPWPAAGCTVPVLSFIICVALYTLAILYRSRSQHGTLPTFVHLLGQQLVVLFLFEFYHLRGTVHLGYTVQVLLLALTQVLVGQHWAGSEVSGEGGVALGASVRLGGAEPEGVRVRRDQTGCVMSWVHHAAICNRIS